MAEVMILAKKRKAKRGLLNTQSIMKYIRLAALVAPAAGEFLGSGSMQDKAMRTLAWYTGYFPVDGTFDASRLMRGWGAYAASVAVTYGIPKLAGLIKGIK